MRNAEKLDTEALPPSLDIPEVHFAVKELAMLTQNDVERNLYELRLKSQLDLASALGYARDEGHAQARIPEIHRLQRFLKQEQTSTEQLQSLPVEQLDQLAEQLANQLEQQLSSPS